MTYTVRLELIVGKFSEFCRSTRSNSSETLHNQFQDSRTWLDTRSPDIGWTEGTRNVYWSTNVEAYVPLIINIMLAAFMWLNII